MKDLSRFTVPELLVQFCDACLAQHETYLTDNIQKRNKLFDSILNITRELKRRGPGERRSLLNLLKDANPQVRYKAATNVYAVARVEAKACLEELASAGLPDVSGAAGMTLDRLEQAPNCLDWI